MIFNVLLAIALAVCVIGLFLRAARWFARGVTAKDRGLAAGARLRSAGMAMVNAVFTGKIVAVLKGVVLDGLFQIRLYRADRARWLAHLLIFWGFVPLLILHAMDGIVTSALFPEYVSTANPWLFLRNFLGLVVVAGLALSGYRRIATRSVLKTTAKDVAALVLVGAVVCSGFLAEGSKIASRSDFYRMIDEWHDSSKTEEVAALEALWVSEYGLAQGNPALDYSAEQLKLGREIHEYSCAECHARPQWAAASYAVSRLVAPFSRNKDGGGLVSFAYWLHVMLGLAGLAWLPFGKMRHVLTGPLSCIADRYAGSALDAPLRAVKRMLALDACTRCGLCSDHCSVGICADILRNRNILPSEKLAALNTGTSNGNGRSQDLLEGLVVCTNCLRCTGVCPVGIDLQDLWDAAREDLLAQDMVDAYELSPLSIHRSQVSPDDFTAARQGLEALRREAFAGGDENSVYDAGAFGGLLQRAVDPGAFRLCFSCKTCTSSCPIVGLEGLEKLGLAPHQIIHATALGLDDLVASSRMLWACLGCYRCQDHCPQGVRVTDVLYTHKNNALARMKSAGFRKES